LTKAAHTKLHQHALASDARFELLYLAETYHDTPDYKLLCASPGGWWLRYREIEGKEEEGYWTLRMCDKPTPEGDIKYSDVADEKEILSRVSEFVPEAAGADSLFAVPKLLHIYARLLTTRAHYHSRAGPEWDMTIDCTMLASNSFMLQGTLRSKNQETLQSMRDVLVSADIVFDQKGIRSKIIEYIFRRNQKLYGLLTTDWKVVDGSAQYCEWHILDEPSLTMSPTIK